MAADISFLGTGWGFPPSFERFEGALRPRMVAAEDDIRESLRILLSTSPGERVMLPQFGCGLRRMVFARIDESTLTAIRDVVGTAVQRFELRVTLDDVQVDLSQWIDGVLLLRLDYRVRATHEPGNLVYPFYALRAA